MAGCVYDNSGNCVKGAVVPHTLALRERATRDVAFPGFNDGQWTELQKSSQGRELIQKADELRVRQQAARKELGEIKLSPAPYKQKAEQIISARKKLDEIGAEIKATNAKAKVIIRMH